MHTEQARQLTAASKMHAGQAKKIEQLGSSSTTTSTSSAHGGTNRTHAGSTWDKQRSQVKGRLCLRTKEERFCTNGPSFYASPHLSQLYYPGGLSKAPQALGQTEEALPTTEHFGILGMMPEQSDDATDNPWV